MDGCVIPFGPSSLILSFYVVVQLGEPKQPQFFSVSKVIFNATIASVRWSMLCLLETSKFTILCSHKPVEEPLVESYGCLSGLFYLFYLAFGVFSDLVFCFVYSVHVVWKLWGRKDTNNQLFKYDNASLLVGVSVRLSPIRKIVEISSSPQKSHLLVVYPALFYFVCLESGPSASPTSIPLCM